MEALLVIMIGPITNWMMMMMMVDQSLIKMGQPGLSQEIRTYGHPIVEAVASLKKPVHPDVSIESWRD